MPPSFERLRREDYADDDHRRASTMRCFLDDRNSFRWPEGLCRTDPSDPTACSFDSKDKDKLEPLFTWERRLNVAKKGNMMSFLEQRKFTPVCQEKTNFRRRFVVKGYIEVDEDEMNEMIEAANMKGLRHPHIAALLGTCSFPGNFWILSYPPGCCDLGDYMASISQELGGRSWRGKSWKLLQQPYKGKEPRAHQIHQEYCWPFRESLGQRLTRLRCYFVCLAQALDYLQTAGLRHRDIKPDNVIIDLSGSVVVVDFGLAKKFPPNAPHWSQSNTNRSFVVYQAPEVLNDKGRDDPSDIFSLGCIFLEMATLILGKNLRSCEEYCRLETNGTAWNWNFGDNLPGVAKWIKVLKETQQADSDDALAPSRGEMIARLPTIELMLSETPDPRPPAHGLWKSFDVPPEKRCRDCHPEHPEVWRPTQDQARAATVAAVDRAKRSLSSQLDGSRLRESKDLSIQARKAVAGESTRRSGSPAPLFSSPLGSPRRGSFDPQVRSASPVLARWATPKPEQQGGSEKTGMAKSTKEENTHQVTTVAKPRQTDIGEENRAEPGTDPRNMGVTGNHYPIESPKPVGEYNELLSSVNNGGFVMIDHAVGGSSEAFASKKGEKRARFDDAPVSVIPSTTEVPENSPHSSLDEDVDHQSTSNQLTPETGALGLHGQEGIWPSKQPQATPIPTPSPVNAQRRPSYGSSEKILVYDEGKQELFTDTTNILRGRNPSQYVGFELPATGTEFHVFAQELDFKYALNLSRLDSTAKLMRRWLNAYRSIYIINFTKMPVSLFDSKRKRWIKQETARENF